MNCFLSIAARATVLALAGGFAGANPIACDSINEPVWYQYSPARGKESADSSVVSVARRGGQRSLITIYSSRSAKYYTTSDGGKTWKVRRGPVSTTNLRGFDLVAVPSDSDVMYKRSNEDKRGMGICFRSQDKGRTWRRPKFEVKLDSKERSMGFNPQKDLDFLLQAIDPSDPWRLYATIAVTKGGTKRHSQLSGVFASQDGGDTWVKFSDMIGSNGAPYGWSEAVIAVSSADSKVMFGLGVGGVVKSINSGETWSPIGQRETLQSRPLYLAEKIPGVKLLGAPNSIEVYQFVFDPRDSQIVHIVSNKGIYRTEDQGETWCLLDMGFNELGAINNALADPDREGGLIVGSIHGVYRLSAQSLSYGRIFPVTARGKIK